MKVGQSLLSIAVSFHRKNFPFSIAPSIMDLEEQDQVRKKLLTASFATIVMGTMGRQTPVGQGAVDRREGLRSSCLNAVI
jgi:hypothetical protein